MSLLERLERLDTERRQYTLNTLAAHLAEAGQYERLRALFDDPDWMKARVAAAGHTATGFHQDLERAWESLAHPSVLRAIEAGAHPAALTDCYRFALIAGSLNSLSGNYVPELIARALVTGRWSDERAIAVSAAIPDADQRTRAFIGLLETGKLWGDALAAAERAAFEALPESDVWQRPYLMARLAPHLPEHLAVRALEAGDHFAKPPGLLRYLGPLAANLPPQIRAKAVTDVVHSVTSASRPGPPYDIPALAPALDPQQLRGMLELALNAIAGLPNQKTSALAQIAPLLPQDLVPEAVAMAGNIKDEGDRAGCLGLLAPRLSGATLDTAVEVARAVRAPGLKAPLTARLARRLDGEERHRHMQLSLDTALGIPNQSLRTRILTEIAAELPEPWRGKAIAKIRTDIAPVEPYWQVKALAELLPLLHGLDRDDVIAQALAALEQITDASYDAPACAALLPHLSGERREHVLARWVRAVIAEKSESGRADRIEALAPQLSGEGAERILHSVTAMRDEKARARALAAIAPRLDGNPLDGALMEASRIADKGPAISVLAACIPALDAAGRDRGIRWCREALPLVRGSYAKPRAFQALAPLLPHDDRQRAAREVLDEVLALVEPGELSQGLNAVAPFLDGESFERALTRALSIESPYHKIEALIPMIPGLDVSRRSRAVELVVEQATRSDDGSVAARLERIGPLLPPEALASVVASANRLKEPGPRALALAGIAVHLKGRSRTRSMREAVAAARAVSDAYERKLALAYVGERVEGRAASACFEAGLEIDDPGYRVEVLGGLIRGLKGKPREAALDAGLLAGLSAPLPEKQHKGSPAVRGLLALIPYLKGAARDRAVARAIEAADALTAASDRLRTFVDILPVCPEPAAPRIRKAFAEMCLEFKDQPRSWLLTAAAAELFAAPAFTPGDLARIARHVMDICSDDWWR